MSKDALQYLPALEGVSEKHLNEVCWRLGYLEFLLWPQQQPIWDLLHSLPPGVKEFVVLCARQFGKSTFGVIMALAAALHYRDACILIMGPETRQTKDIVGPKMRFLTKTAPKGLIVPQKADNRYHVYHDLNRSASDYTEIVMGGMNENSGSQRGKTVKRIFVEEVVDVPEDQFTESIRSDLGPAMMHASDGKIIYLTSLPKIPDHPFITETMVKAERNKALIVFDIWKNDALTEEQKWDAIELAGGIDSDDCKRELLCLLVRDKRRVCLPDWDQDNNVYEFELPTYLHMHTTIDWGGVRDKTVACLHFYDYMTDTDMFWDERVFEPMTASSVIMAAVREMESEFVKLRTHYSIRSSFIDAPYQFVYVDLIDQYNYSASIPEKPDWMSSVNTLNNRFKRKKAVIHPRCTFLVLSARSGMFNKLKTDYERTESLGHCDGIVTMGYAVKMRDTSDPSPLVFHAQEIMHANQMPSKESIIRSTNSTYVEPKKFGVHKRRIN